MEDSSKPMHDLARLDYDKVKSAPAKSASVQAGDKARAEAQGRRIMSELVRRQKIAEQLRSGGR
jgi:hypothetical protein